MMEGINMMEMMPRMMMSMMGGGESGSGMMGMMSRMMGGGQGAGTPMMMPHMMTHMMPHCVNMMLPGVPKEERTDFVLNMVTSLMEQGSAGMSDEEKNELVAKVIERVTR
jgi:hypothetical protein